MLSRTPARLPGLDLLRAVAIGWVMLYHLASYGVPLPGVADHGWMGVDLFFVLSGYLIGWQLLKPYACGEQPLWSQFFMRRAWRVLPAYLTVLALYFAVPAMREGAGIAPLWQFLTFTTNLFADYSRHRAFSHAWSLSVEEQFYLLLPLIVWMLAQRPSPRRIAALAIGVLVGGMVLRGWLWQHEVAPYAGVHGGEGNFVLRYVEQIYNPTYTRLDGLLAGVMLAVIKAFRPVWWERALRAGAPILVAGLAGVFASTRLDPNSAIGVVVVFPLLSASLALVVLAAHSGRTWLGRLAVPGARTVAAMAFSLYLTHKQAFHWLKGSFGPALEQAGILATGIYLGAALVAATLLYVAVERPGLRLRDRFMAAPKRPATLQPA